MKHRMLLGLSAIAVAASMAAVGAGSAIATETALCNSPTTESGKPTCANQHLWEAGTVIHAVSETFLIIEFPPFGTIECEESTLQATTEKTTAMPLLAKVEALTFGKGGECGEISVTTVEPGKLAIENIDQPAPTHDGTLTFTGTKIKVVIFGGLECMYLVEHAGTLTGGAQQEQGTVDLSGTLKKVGGSIFCPAKNVNFLGFYKVTSPFALWVST